jgi:hypothetical protein
MIAAAGSSTPFGSLYNGRYFAQNRDALNAHWQASAAGDAVTEYIITYQGRPAYTVSIMEIRDDGKVVHETQYFADPFEAPAWRKQWVQQMP